MAVMFGVLLTLAVLMTIVSIVAFMCSRYDERFAMGWGAGWMLMVVMTVVAWWIP